MILTKRLILYLTAAFILAGCELARPLTPEQRAAINERHCRQVLIGVEEQIDQELYAKEAEFGADFKELGMDDNSWKLFRSVLRSQATIDKQIAYRACLQERRSIFGN